MLISRPVALRSRRRRRAMAAVCALVFVSSNALAALGLCVAKASAPASSELLAAEPCPQHVTDDGPGVPDQPSAAPHCPQEDPGAQARAADLPTSDLPLMVAQVRAPLADAQRVARCHVTVDDSPPKPLYTRLSRLLL